MFSFLFCNHGTNGLVRKYYEKWLNVERCFHVYPNGSLRITSAKKDKLEAKLFFIKTIHEQDDFLGLISIQGIVKVILNDQSFFRRVKAYQHVHGVRTAGSQRLEMLQECWR